MPEVAPRGIRRRLNQNSSTYKVELVKPPRPGRWLAYVDAYSGEIVRFYDTNLYATRGSVTAVVHPEQQPDPEASLPIENQQVVVAAETTVTDALGSYLAAADGSVQFELRSPPGGGGFEVLNAGGPEGSVSVPNGATVDHLWDDGNSRADERNVFYHLQRARRHGMRHVSLPWFGTIVTANVNVGQVCDAHWDGAANFYQPGCGSFGCCNDWGRRMWCSLRMIRNG